MTGSGVIICGNGTKEWWRDGKKHREDGPAVIKADGTREWWLNGEAHRDGAPAVILPNGQVYWYQHDQRHRDDGPAVIRPDGSVCWYKNDQLHREDGPAVIRENGEKHWRRNDKEWPEGECLFPGDPKKDFGPGRDPAAESERPDAGGNSLEEKMTAADCALLVGTDGDTCSVTIYEDGRNVWKRGNAIHREDGAPAVIQPDGTREWYLYGNLSRADGPAIEHADGTKEWFKNGLRHREDGPAVISPGGPREWYLNGNCHRDGGPAVEKPDGTKEWFRNGHHHREDGPAIEQADGRKYWYLEGQPWPEGEKKYYAEVGAAAAKDMKEACTKSPVTAAPRAVFRSKKQVTP